MITPRVIISLRAPHRNQFSLRSAVTFAAMYLSKYPTYHIKPYWGTGILYRFGAAPKVNVYQKTVQDWARGMEDENKRSNNESFTNARRQREERGMLDVSLRNRDKRGLLFVRRGKLIRSSIIVSHFASSLMPGTLRNCGRTR